MKRHQLVLLVCGVLMAGVCLGAGWFLFSAMTAKQAAEEARNDKYGELKSIYQAKVFPNAENIERVSADEKALKAWLVTASNLVHQGDLQVEPMTPTGFKQTLQATVRKLSEQPGTLNGKVVAAGSHFGFDKYLGASPILPAQEHVERLSQQLTVIENICKELYAAEILCLEKVTRETFDEQAADRPGATEARGSRRPRKEEPGRAPAPAAGPGATGGYFTKQRFTFEFQARPAAFVAALNRLAAMELFVVVAETEFCKTEDPLGKRTQKKKPGAGEAAEGGAVTLTHVNRIVTDPELEPPVRVKLDIDVYAFKGV